MKKTIFTTTLVICSMLIASCSDSGKSVSQQNQPNQANTPTANQINSESPSVNQPKLDNQENNSTSSEKTPIKNNKPNVIENKNPSFGTIKDMQNGDLKCYVSVIDGNGKLHEGVGAIFEVCQPDKYINKNVSLSYELENVNDCQSAEPCRKTIKEWLITKIEIRDEKSQSSSY